MWKKGKVEVDGTIFDYQVKQFPKASQFGIDGGRVSKLSLKNKAGKWVVNYDRGWDIKPKTDVEKTAVEMILKEHN